MTLNKFLILLLVMLSVQLHCDEQHRKPNVQTEMAADSNGRPESWIQWLGGFHLLLLHFPIALIWFTGFSDLMYRWMKNPIYSAMSRITLIAAAILTIPTAIFGLMLKFTSTFEGADEALIFYHLIAGIITMGLALIVVWIRESTGFSKIYGIAFILLLISVSITGYLGGSVSFGPEVMYFPKS
ncbi:MAG: hypothetical protein K1X28_05145 [Parachlamydiales bacterium]|nr:hypothetical protein [Parachlamydiales bacterium]